MKIQLAPLTVAVFAMIPLLFNCADAEAARNEHRPICSADGSRLIYMTDEQWSDKEKNR